MKKFSNLGKEIDFQEVQDAQKVLKKLDPRKHTPKLYYSRLKIRRES